MGLETVVRPVVFPNIRPSATRALPIEDAPDKGLAVITGGSGGVVDLPYSESTNWTKSRSVESRRKFDRVRIYATTGGGTVDRSQYIDVEVMRAVSFLENEKVEWNQQFAPFKESENSEIIARNLTRQNK